LMGGMTLLGWMLDLPLLTRIVAGDVAMQANAALAFVLCGLSLAWFTREPLRPIEQRLAQAAALIVAAIGLITLVEYLFGWDAGIDLLLFRDPSGTVAIGSAGRMGPNTAIGFLLSGTALWMLHLHSGWWLGQVMASAVSLIALIALIGYAYGVPFLYGSVNSVALAAPTAVAFIVLCAGIFTATPDRALGEIVGSDRIGGDAARRLLPIAIILPPVLGWLRLAGQRAGMYDTEHGVAILVTAVIALATAAVIWIAWILNCKDDERLHAQSALHVIDARFRATFEQAAVGIAHVAPDGHWLRVNQKACDIVGYSQAELQYRTCHDITHPDDLDAEREHIQQMLDGKISTYAMEKRCVRKDGSMVWVSLTVSMARTPDGAVDYFISVIKDIDERVAAQLQMRKLWSAIEQSVEIVTVHDRHGVIEYVNPAFEAITGYSSTEAIGRKGSLVKSGKQDQAFYHRLWDTVLRGEVFRAVFINRRKDSTLYHEEKTITPLCDAVGTITHFVATGKDITARVEADKALLESEQYNRRLFETAAIGLAVSHMDGRLIDVNPAYARLIGRSVEEMVQLTRWQITPEKYHQQDILALKQLRDTGRYDAYEKEYIHRDGHLVPVRMSGVTLENNGEPCIWSSVEDVTEQKQAESRIKHLNRMYALLSAINQMLVHVRDRDEILSESCRIAVEVGGFNKAWIGVVEEGSAKVRVVAWQGAKAFFVGLQDRLDAIAPSGEGILPKVIASKQAVVSNDVAHDTRVNLRASIIESDSLAIAVFPMLVDGEVVAVLSLHANEIGYFNDEELKLLRELTGDIGFALE
ncbi:MAG: PAS domain S-box protein, partial [Dokdonella sp.]